MKVCQAALSVQLSHGGELFLRPRVVPGNRVVLCLGQADPSEWPLQVPG